MKILDSIEHLLVEEVHVHEKEFDGLLSQRTKHLEIAREMIHSNSIEFELNTLEQRNQLLPIE